MNGKDSVLFSKKSDEWATPQWLFDVLDKEFEFDCDAAATPENRKCPSFHSDKFVKGWFVPCGDKIVSCMGDALIESWYKATYFLNPPHSKIKQFMKKAYEESLKGAVVVCLIPCRTDTYYWHDYVMKAHEIRFIMGRLKFGDSQNAAPFPSCIVIFDHSKYDKNNDPVFKTMRQPKL